MDINESNTNFKKIFSELIGEETINSLEPILDYLPYIGKIISVVKFKRLETRLKKLESRIKIILDSMNQGLDETMNEFIRNKAFPIFINELLEEHEEEKIDLIMNGIEYTYENNIRSESKILIYYDVLRALRVDELKRLYYYATQKKVDIFEFKRFNPKMNQRLTEDEVKAIREKNIYESYIDNHLEMLNLIKSRIHRKLDELESIVKETSNSSGSLIEITFFGKDFIDFIDLKVNVTFAMNEVLE